MNTGVLIRELRQKHGLTQVVLAAKSGIALPTLQQLEAGTSNPSVATLGKLGLVLGFTLELRPRRCNWSRLSELGLPLMSESQPAVRAIHLSSEQLFLELRCGIQEVIEEMPSGEAERKREACAALLIAIFEQYPTVFRSAFGHNKAARELIKNPTGRVIKLKRLALATIAEYL